MTATASQRSNLSAMMGTRNRHVGVPLSMWKWLTTNKRYSDSYHLKKIDRELAIEFRKVLKELDLLEEL